MEFTRIARHLEELTGRAGALLAAKPEVEWRARYEGSSGWTRVELLGHLIDSAINNQQRFARALIENELTFPSYAQEEMVRVQHYGAAAAGELVELWAGLNRHIAFVLERAPEGKRETPCVIGTNAAMPLGVLVEDYVAHLEHHLRQLAGEAALPYSGLPWPPADRWGDEVRGSGRPW
jgi:hypothetical protein